jgi:hypothetical protein
MMKKDLENYECNFYYLCVSSMHLHFALQDMSGGNANGIGAKVIKGTSISSAS